MLPTMTPWSALVRHAPVPLALTLLSAACGADSSTAASSSSGQLETTTVASTGDTAMDPTGFTSTVATGSSTNDPRPPPSSSSAADSTSDAEASSTSGEGSDEATTGGADPVTCPAAPGALTRWQVGNDEDAAARPSGPALLMMGGGPDVDTALEAALAFADGGDVVVVRASGADGYNDYLFSELGGVDSVETLLVDSAALAQDPYVACRVGAAEVVWFAGGDQADYMTLYANSALADAVQAVHEAGGVVGGTSAGLAILGGHVFAAYQGTVYPEEVLEDPYNQFMELDVGPFAFAGLERVITDSHFYERDRMGRIVGFLGRLVQDETATEPRAVGVDEGTALLIGPSGQATVYGEGFVYVVEGVGTPQVCQPGTPLTYQALPLWRLQAGDTVSLEPSVTASVEADTVGAQAGVLVPVNPY